MIWTIFLQLQSSHAQGLKGIGYQSVLDSERSLRGADGKDIATVSWGGPKPYWNLIGNGGLIMTPNAMIKFRQAFLEGRLVSPEAVALIQTPHVREGDGAPSFYGYGLVVQDHPKLGQFYWHNGGNGIFTANWTGYADTGDFVFAVAGPGDLGADDAVMRITEALFDIELRRQMPKNDEAPELSEQTIANVKRWRWLLLKRSAPRPRAIGRPFLKRAVRRNLLASHRCIFTCRCSVNSTTSLSVLSMSRSA